MSKTFEVKLNNIEDLFNKQKKYYIPSLQRNFVWQSNDVKDMLDDFVNDTKDFDDIKNNYLFGSILLITKNEKFDIVDGQQRLTVLSLLLKYIELSSNIRFNDNPKFKNVNDEIGMSLTDIKLKAHNSYYDKINHSHLVNFGGKYNEILSSSKIQVYSYKEAFTESENNIVECWNEIVDYLKRKKYSDEKFVNFSYYIIHNVQLVNISSAYSNKAYQYFNALNNRGRYLKPIDLIKNLFLSYLDDGYKNEDIKSFDLSWSKLMDNLNFKNSNSSDFLQQFVMSNYSNKIQQENIYSFILKKIELKEENAKSFILDILEKMVISSEIYKKIKLNPIKVFDYLRNNDEEIENNMFILNKIFKIKQFIPIFMFCYIKCLKRDEISLIVNGLVRYGLIVQYTNGKQRFDNGVHNIINSYISKIHDPYILYQSIEDNIQKDADKLKLYYNTEIDNNKAVKLLRFIEIYINKNDNAKNNGKNESKIEKEHILPQNSPYKSSLLIDTNLNEDNINQNLNLIGNLSLLRKSMNSALGDRKFKDKINGYLSSGFIITKSIVSDINIGGKKGKGKIKSDFINKYQKNYKNKCENGVWTREAIKDRSKDLTDLLLCAAKCPMKKDILNFSPESNINYKKIFNIEKFNKDDNIFKFSKPLILCFNVSFDGKKLKYVSIKGKSWKQILINFFNEIYDRSDECFKNIIKDSWFFNKRINLKEKNKRVFSILKSGDSIYSNLSTHDIVLTIHKALNILDVDDKSIFFKIQ